MDLNLSITIPMWFVYSYFIVGFVAAFLLSVWARYRISPRRTWSEHFKRTPIVGFLITVLAWPFVIFMDAVDSLRTKKSLANYRHRVQREKEYA